MLICLITYSVYIHRLVDFSPQNTYEVYDSLGGAQARLLLPKKKSPTTYNGESGHVALLPRRTTLGLHRSSDLAISQKLHSLLKLASQHKETASL